MEINAFFYPLSFLSLDLVMIPAAAAAVLQNEVTGVRVKSQLALAE